MLEDAERWASDIVTVVLSFDRHRLNLGRERRKSYIHRERWPALEILKSMVEEI